MQEVLSREIIFGLIKACNGKEINMVSYWPLRCLCSPHQYVLQIRDDVRFEHSERWRSETNHPGQMRIAFHERGQTSDPKFHSFAEYVAVYSQGLLQPFDRDNRFSWRMSIIFCIFRTRGSKEAVSYLGHVGRPSGRASE